MKRIALLAIAGFVLVSGWALARQQEMLKHSDDVRMQPMQDASCTPSSSPGGQ